LTFHLLAIGTRTSTVMGMMAVIYVGALLFMLRNGYSSFCEGVVAEERARQAEEVLRDSIEALGDGFVLYDADLRVVMHNRRYLDHFNYHQNRTSIVGMTLEEQQRAALAAGFFDPGEDYVRRAEAGIEQRIADFRSEQPTRRTRRTADGRTLLIGTHPMPG